MKIDAMVEREDFYKINEATLERYFEKCGTPVKITTVKTSRRAFAYVYEKLNAIIARNPGKDVKNFLETEYRVKGCLLRKILVKLYMFIVFNTNGLFADKVLVADSFNIDFTNILIYPCNKKIRVFDFNKNVVDVIIKDGFPNYSIKNEIDFRLRYQGIHIEPILSSGENWYHEKIIDGKPLARIPCLNKYVSFKEKSLNILRTITEQTRHILNSTIYINRVIGEIESKAEILLQENISWSNNLQKIINLLKDKLSIFDEDITLTLSHGDFHHGNIWVENSSKRIVIIDWETTAIRSEWYDTFTLFGGMREINGIKKLLSKVSNDISIDYIKCRDLTQFKNIILLVILEDVLYRITELECISVEIGIDEFDIYCSNLYDDLLKVR